MLPIHRALRGAALFVGLVAAPALASAQALTADAVAERAVRTSPDVRARDLDLGAAAAGVDQALVAFFPRLSVGASYTRLSDLGTFLLGNIVVAPGQPLGPVSPNAPLLNVPLSIPSLSNSTQLAATLVVPLSDYLLRLPQAMTAAERTRDGARFTLDAARRRAALEARLAFYQWVRARMQSEVARSTLAQTREHRDDAQRLQAAGALARVDVLRAETQVANAELLVARADALREASEERVRTAMHLADATPLGEVEEITESGADPTLPATLAAMVDEAVAQRPELRALAAQRDGFAAQARATRATYLPVLSATAQALYADPNPRIFPPRDQFDGTWSLGVALSYSPNDTASGAAGARGLEARAASVDAQAASLRDALRTDLATAAGALRESVAAAQSTARGLESAEEAHRVRRELFRAGRATTAELTDAETDLLRARIERTNAVVDRRVARARIEYLLGRADDAAR